MKLYILVAYFMGGSSAEGRGLVWGGGPRWKKKEKKI